MVYEPDEDFVEVETFEQLPPIVQDKVIFKFMEASEINGIDMARPRAEAMAKEYYFKVGSTRMVCKISEAHEHGNIDRSTG